MQDMLESHFILTLACAENKRICISKKITMVLLTSNN